MVRPTARSEGLLVQDVVDELVIMDVDSYATHALDRTATAIWRACDGTRTGAEIAVAVGLDPDVVDLTLLRLSDIGLLVDEHGERLDDEAVVGVDRRRLLRSLVRAGSVAISLPLISSIVAPTAALAVGSTSPTTTVCVGATDVRPGFFSSSVTTTVQPCSVSLNNCPTGYKCQRLSGNNGMCVASC